MACQPSNISTRARRVAKCFDAASRVTAPNFSSQEIAGDVKVDDAYALFKLWAGNLGVFHPATDTRSLDYRLRQEREVTDRVFEILNELESLLNKVLAPGGNHTTEAAQGEQAEPLDEAEAFLVGLLDLETSPECQSTWLAASITDSVRRLFKISALIEKSTARDRYAKAEGNVECQFSDQYDVAHVRDKHSRGSAWLLERLGKAITKRRQFLKYAELHRNKLESLPQTASIAVPQDVAVAAPLFDFSFNKTHAPSHFSKPSLQNTTASTIAKIDTSFVDDGFDENRSSFSAATSIRDGRSADRLRVVRLEEVTKEKGEYFLCPYCRTTQKFNGQFAWEQHVYSDLRAYICTFRQCGMRMFEKKSAWMQHEMEEHRRVWTCQLCEKTNFANDISLAKHLEEKHHFTTDDGTSTALVETGSSVMKMIPVDDCPLCDWQTIMEGFNDKSTTGEKLLVPAKRFMKHVAGHLEELALFALPRPLADEDHDQSALSQSGTASAAGLWGDASELSLHSSPSRLSSEVGYAANEDGPATTNEDKIEEIKELTERDRTNNSITSNTSPIPGFPCVFHRGGSPSRDISAFCHKRERFVSELSSHHALRNGAHPGGPFLYCQRCFTVGNSDEALQGHNCQFVCVTDGCPNYALPASNHDQPCWHGNENDERSIWRKLYRIAHDITDHDPRVPDPSDPKSLQDHAWRLKTTPFESNTMSSQDSNRGLCPIATCGRHVKDLKAHMLTHLNERPEKCPIPSCVYHIKGFARKYDQNRHALSHYKGTMVCAFCPGSGSGAERSFNRADVFKRHLTSVHGVKQTPPHARRKKSNPIQSAMTPFAPRQSSGVCSTCGNIFASAQDFYEHLDDCVLRVVQQTDPREAINEKLLAPLVADSEFQQTMDKHMLPISDKAASFEDEESEEDEDGQLNESATKARKPFHSYKGRRKIYPDAWGMPFVAASDELIQPFSVLNASPTPFQ